MLRQKCFVNSQKVEKQRKNRTKVRNLTKTSENDDFSKKCYVILKKFCFCFFFFFLKVYKLLSMCAEF